ncbi:MAG: hypothetical protein WA990_15450 [Rubrobacteraceae bacterium]
MSGGKVHRIQDIRRRREARNASRPTRDRQHTSVPPRPVRTVRTRRKTRQRPGILTPIRPYVAEIRKHKKAVLGALIFVGVITLVFVVLGQSSGAAEQPPPVNPKAASPDAVLAEALGVEVSTPVRPGSLAGLGYHPEDKGSVELEPRGKNLSAGPLRRLLGVGGTPEDIRYYVMARAEREGPITGALDVGAEAGSEVYAPVSGTVTAVRPDPTMREANIVEIKPTEQTNLRVYVSLVQNPSGDVGPGSPVVAGETLLGTVVDSAAVLDPQLSSYTGGGGNHVTVSALQVG